MNRRRALNALKLEVYQRRARGVGLGSPVSPETRTPCNGIGATLVASLGIVHTWSCSCGARGHGYETAEEMIAARDAHLPAGAPRDYSYADVTRRSA